MSKSLSNLLVVAGGVGVAGSVLWWHTFYTEVGEFLGTRAPLPTECIYTLGGPCGLVTGVAGAIGANVYDPRLFWGSAAAFAIGAILRVIPDGDDDDDYQPRQRHQRRDPTL